MERSIGSLLPRYLDTVIDDEEGIRDVLETILQDGGHIVALAETASDLPPRIGPVIMLD